jgi:DNA (cytosine-5)-methyltransferase 1
VIVLRFIDFFAGVGGFRLGMEMAGHECTGHCEIDPYADKSYRAMHRPKEGEWFASDIRRVNPGELPEADCYCGGFPCQAFSIAGKRGGFADTRGTLFFEVMRLARERKPKYIFLENVAGLLSHDNGNTFATIIQSFADNGYDVQWQILNSKDFGVPQNRERVFFIGHSRGQRRPEIFPIRGTNGETLKQIVGGSQTERIYAPGGLSPCLDTMQGGNKQPKIVVFQKTHGSTTTLHNNETGTLQSARIDKVPCAEVRPVLTPDRPEKRQNGRRMKEDGEPMFTLTAQDKHGAKIRRLTPKECFRLQGFPDEYFYRARAVNSDSQLYKQAGNSVSVPVIYEIAKRLGRW